MRTTLTIGDELFAKAKALAQPGIELTALLRECIKAFIQRQTAHRLAALRGRAPDIEPVPQRRDQVGLVKLADQRRDQIGRVGGAHQKAGTSPPLAR